MRQVGPFRFCQFGLWLFQAAGSLCVCSFALFHVPVVLESAILGGMNLFMSVFGKIFRFASLLTRRVVFFFLDVKVRAAD